MAGKANLTLEKGAPAEKRLIWRTKAKRPVLMAGFSALLEVRSSVSGPVILSLTTQNGGIELSETTGLIVIKFTEEQIASLPASSAYKLSITPLGGVKRYLLEGKITVSPWG